eukprot:TRINITY_DN3371_c0_g1_i1.p1 TRINITY_DN3371_c0_g1~~TRINITY_DN3371_c0_g1_i1.p1  ORF type:complete len:347 (-),score=50.83 TRINITY_DN3371_c0_g1_i1:87-977(-)
MGNYGDTVNGVGPLCIFKTGTVPPIWCLNQPPKIPSNQLVFLAMHPDGNLVFYRSDILWASNTISSSLGVNQTLQLDPDGNMVIYRNNQSIWSLPPGHLFSESGGPSSYIQGVGSTLCNWIGRGELKNGDYSFKFNINSLTVYDDRTNTIVAGKWYWSFTVGEKIVLSNLEDGNVILYRMNYLWSTNTTNMNNNTYNRVTLENDGNLVVYSGNQVLWRAWSTEVPTDPPQPFSATSQTSAQIVSQESEIKQEVPVGMIAGVASAGVVLIILTVVGVILVAKKVNEGNYDYLWKEKE